jgi:cytoskeletal protein CcmA (bactofilin family)
MIKIRGSAPDELNGFMDQGTQFHGELRFRDSFRIDGELKGRIVSDNTLIVGRRGRWTRTWSAPSSPSAAP